MGDNMHRKTHASEVPNVFSKVAFLLGSDQKNVNTQLQQILS